MRASSITTTPSAERVGAAAAAAAARRAAARGRRRREEAEDEQQRLQPGIAAPDQPEPGGEQRGPADRLAPEPQARRELGADEAHRQSPSAACHSVSAAQAAVSARSTRGPSVTGSTKGSAAQPRRLLGGEAALGADQDRPGPGRGGGERRRGRGGGARLVAEHQPAGRVPGVEQRLERHRAGDVEDVGLAALLGGLDGVGAQPLGLDALGVGVAGEDRQHAGGAELGRLLDDEVGARLLDRGEDQPEVGRAALRPARRAAGDRAAEPAGAGDRPRATRRRGR